MQANTIYEQNILNEIKGLTLNEQAKLARIFHSIRQEITTFEDKAAKQALLSICGTWEGDKTIEQQLQTIYRARHSTDRDIF